VPKIITETEQWRNLKSKLVQGKFIYSDVAIPVLSCISKALLKCIEIGNDSKKLTPENPELINCFDSLNLDKTVDLHILEGLFNSHQKRGEKVYPRILKLTLNAYKDARDVKVRSGYILPSPLHILYYTLIVPEHSQTAGYSLASCRTLLFNLLEENYRKNNPSANVTLLDAINEEDVSASTDSLSRHIKIQARWPKDIKTSSLKSYKNMIVGHFLAMKGITHLWFDTDKEAKNFLTFTENQSFFETFSDNLLKPRFRLSNKYDDLPDTGELINQLYGIPLPIKGAEVVFFGGMKPSSSGGIVVGLSGQAGIGKTSFALALANSLAPLAIKCFYLSLEEDINDIKKRLSSLQTPYEKKLSIYQKTEKWFFPVKSNLTLDLNDFYKLINKFSQEVRANTIDSKYYQSIIVVDNLNEFFDSKDYALIEKLVEKLRELKSIVILIGGEGVLEKLKLEYLVDTGIKLLHEGLDKKGEKPLRLFNLYKTRQQISRQGTHIFHLSGQDGFRISPQIPSQMDRKEKLKRYLHDENNIIHALNYLNDDKKAEKIYDRETEQQKGLFFKVFPRTHILVHGYGSAGKAGFALKLLLTPPIENQYKSDDISNLEFSSSIYRRKVLVISFLYPQKYYHELVFEKGELYRKINNNYKSLPDPIIEYLIFYPGFISPEDFINKITRKIDESILEGQPFTGILIDGLHNVFLQFVKLQENDMVWPLLYNILARYDLTVVSTFTNFALNDRLLDNEPQSRNQMINQSPDHLLMQKGMAPFLHALVKASDYYFFLEQLILHSGERKYLLSIKGGIGQSVPTDLLEWDRQRNVFIKAYKYKEVLEMMENINA